MATEQQRLTFISYSRADKDFALELAKELRSSGFHIWLDQLDIPTGARWDDEVEKALVESDIFMVILTPRSIASTNVKDEIGYAIDGNKRILPVLLENANVPLRLRRFQYVDFTNVSYKEGIELSKQLLRKLLAERTEPRSASQTDSQSHQIREEIEKKTTSTTNAERLARQRAEAIKAARDKEQAARQSPQTHPVQTATVQAPDQRSPRRTLTPILIGIPFLLLLCLGGGAVAWRYIFPTDTPSAPATERPTLVTPPTSPPIEATTEVPPAAPTTPAAPSSTVPTDPAEFIYFYFENINDRNYDLTWSLLSEAFKTKFNPGGKEPYMELWNKVSNVVIYDADYTKISDTSAVVIVNSNIQSRPLNYYLIRNNPQSTWLFDPMPASYDVSCSQAPKSLSVGITAQVVTAREDLLLRNEPTDGTVIEELPPGSMVVVIDGPVCKYYRAGSVFFWWWKVQSEKNLGWIVEGHDSRDPVFIQPAP